MKVRNFIEKYEQFSVLDNHLLKKPYIKTGNSVSTLKNSFETLKKLVDSNYNLDEMFFSKLVEFFNVCTKDLEMDIEWSCDIDLSEIQIVEKGHSICMAYCKFHSMDADYGESSYIRFILKECTESIIECARDIFKSPQFTETSDNNNIRFRVNNMYRL